jgi:hypothetical protein
MATVYITAGRGWPQRGLSLGCRDALSSRQIGLHGTRAVSDRQGHGMDMFGKVGGQNKE